MMGGGEEVGLGVVMAREEVGVVGVVVGSVVG